MIVTQGVLYALGGTLLYTPTVTFLDEWFVKRKGFAYGIMWVSVVFRLNRGQRDYDADTVL